MVVFNIQNLGTAKKSFGASPSTGAALCSAGFHGQVCSCKVIYRSPIRQAASSIGALLVSVLEEPIFSAIQLLSLAGHFSKVMLPRVLNSALGFAGFRQPILPLKIFPKGRLFINSSFMAPASKTKAPVRHHLPTHG